MITINLTKWWHAAIAAAPLLALIATFALWVDTRYMHKHIQARQNVEIQLDIAKYRVKQYMLMEKNGIALTVDEEMDYEARQRQVEDLEEEKNCLLGISKCEDKQ